MNQLVTIDGNGSLYAVLFSTGLIKIGRGKRPEDRIASHGNRLSCTGIKIVESFHAKCAGSDVDAERRLIKRCSNAAGTKRLNEWFEELDFSTVVQWVKDESAVITTCEPSAQISKKSNVDQHQNFIDEDIDACLFSRAKRLAELSIAISTMDDDQANCVYDALVRADKFIVNDCTCFSDDLTKEGISVINQIQSLIGHAFEIAKSQYKYWWRGVPSKDLMPADCSSLYFDQKQLLGV